MRRPSLLLPALPLFLLAASASVGRGEGAGPAPKLVLEAARFDAGPVVRGDTFRAVFVVRNEGGGDLHVQEVRSSCGCAVASFDRVVPAKGEGRVTLAVDTRLLSGAVTRTALLVSDDPATPQATLTVAAQVATPVLALPTGYLRVEALQGRGGSASQLLVSDDPAFLPASPETEVPWMTASVATVPEGERIAGRGKVQYRLALAVSPEAPEGLLGGAVRVKTGLARPSVLEVPVAGFVRPSVSLSSARLDFRNFVPGWEPVRRILVVTGNDESVPFAIRSATTTVKGVTIRTVPLDDHRVEVTLTAEPSIPKGPFEGELVLGTSDRLRPEIRVPVKGTALVREK